MNYINLIEKYIPDEEIDVLNLYPILTDKFQYSKTFEAYKRFTELTGYKKVRREVDHDRIKMLEKLFQKLLAKASFEPGEIDIIIFSTDIPDNYTDSKIYQLYFMNKYGYKNASYIVVNQQCGTQLNAINLADSLIISNKANKVLVLSHAFVDNHRIPVIDGIAVRGEGAAALLISKDSHAVIKLLDFYTFTNSTYYDLKETPNNGKAYYKYLECTVKSIQAILNKNKMKLNEVQAIIPQNVNQLEWEYCCSKLKYPISQVFLENIPKYGHMGDADAIINLDCAYNSNFIKVNDKVLVHSVGAGGTFNTLLVSVK